MKEETARRSSSSAESEEVAFLKNKIHSLETKLKTLLRVQQDSLNLIRQYEARFAQLIDEGRIAKTDHHSTPNEPRNARLSPTSVGPTFVSPNPANDAQEATPVSSRRNPNPIGEVSSAASSNSQRQRREIDLLTESLLRRKSSNSSQSSKSIRKTLSPNPRKLKRSRMMDMDNADSPDLLLFRNNNVEEDESPMATQLPVTVPSFGQTQTELDVAVENKRPSNGSMIKTQSPVTSLSRRFEEEEENPSSSPLFHSVETHLPRGNRSEMMPKAPSTPKGYWDMLTLPEDSEPKSPKVRLAQLGLFRPRLKKTPNS